MNRLNVCPRFFDSCVLFLFQYIQFCIDECLSWVSPCVAWLRGPLSSTPHFLHHLLPCRAHTGREGFAGYCFKSLAQFVDEFGPVFHLFVGKLGALCPYGIRRFRVGEAHEAEVDEVCADSFLVVRLSQKQVEHKAKLCGSFSTRQRSISRSCLS